MGVHLLIIGKFKLLGGGHGGCQFLASLLCPFALKLPFVVARLPNSCSDLAVSLRYFLFRLGRVFLVDTGRSPSSTPIRRYTRWERALRLLHDRAVGNGDHSLRALGHSDDMLTAISMLTL